MVFCNVTDKGTYYNAYIVTILILVDGFLQYFNSKNDEIESFVTILILVDGFLQYTGTYASAYVLVKVTILILVDGFLQY